MCRPRLLIYNLQLITQAVFILQLTRLGECLHLVEPLLAHIVGHEAGPIGVLLQDVVESLLEGLIVRVVFPVEEDIGLGVHDRGRIDSGHVGVVEFVPLLVLMVQGVGRVVTAAGVAVVADDASQVIRADLHRE